MLEVYIFSHRNCSSTPHEYAQLYPEKRPPNREYLKQIIENLRSTTSFDKKWERIKRLTPVRVETDNIAFSHANPQYALQNGYVDYHAFYVYYIFLTF